MHHRFSCCYSWCDFVISMLLLLLGRYDGRQCWMKLKAQSLISWTDLSTLNIQQRTITLRVISLPPSTLLLWYVNCTNLGNMYSSTHYSSTHYYFICSSFYNSTHWFFSRLEPHLVPWSQNNCFTNIFLLLLFLSIIHRLQFTMLTLGRNFFYKCLLKLYGQSQNYG